MYNETIIHYSKNPFNKFEMENPSVDYVEENTTCWDSLTIFLLIEDNIIKDWSFYWDTALITTACGGIFWESIIWEKLENVLQKDYKSITDLVWDEISERRKKAAVHALLSTRNAIHKYLDDGIKDDFDDVIPN